MRVILTTLLTFLILAATSQGFRVRHYIPEAFTALSKAIFETSPGNYVTGSIIAEGAVTAFALRVLPVRARSYGKKSMAETTFYT